MVLDHSGHHGCRGWRRRGHPGCVCGASEGQAGYCGRFSGRFRSVSSPVAERERGIIVRFRDLGMRNRWLASAKNLRGRADDISISPDLPPVLRPIKTELLTKRKSLNPDEKKAHLKYLRQWPYVVLAVGKDKTIKPATTTKTVINSILGFSPLMTFA